MDPCLVHLEASPIPASTSNKAQAIPYRTVSCHYSSSSPPPELGTAVDSTIWDEIYGKKTEMPHRQISFD